MRCGMQNFRKEVAVKWNYGQCEVREILCILITLIVWQIIDTFPHCAACRFLCVLYGASQPARRQRRRRRVCFLSRCVRVLFTQSRCCVAAAAGVGNLKPSETVCLVSGDASRLVVGERLLHSLLAGRGGFVTERFWSVRAGSYGASVFESARARARLESNGTRSTQHTARNIRRVCVVGWCV